MFSHFIHRGGRVGKVKYAQTRQGLTSQLHEFKGEGFAIKARLEDETQRDASMSPPHH